MDPAEKKHDIEAQKKKKPGEEAASSPTCAIGAFIGLHGQTRI
jgi:hypothetical protein